VSAVLILIDGDHFEQAYGRLMAEGVRDIRHLKDEEELPTLCQQEVLRTAPYQVAVTVD
jgi:hypothetical protein